MIGDSRVERQPPSWRGGRLRRNTLLSLAQSVVVTASFIVVYRLLVEHVGLDRVGIWSLLLGATAFVRIGDVSGVGALSRYVASALAEHDLRRARDYVHTVLMTSLVLNTALTLIILAVAPFVLELLVAEKYLQDAGDLLPYIVMTIVAGSAASGICSAIDGAQRADQRAIVVSTSALLFVLATWLLVPVFGVTGYGAAHVLQQILIMALGWLTLRKSVPDLGWMTTGWRRSVFVETTGYAIRLQGISTMNSLFEPVAKLAFNVAGGPAMVAYFDLASRLIVQFRALVIAAASPLIPTFAAYRQHESSEFEGLLEKATRMLTLASIGTALVSLVTTPVISWIVLGELEPEVLRINAALALGWSINLLSASFYLAAQARGILRWNFVGTSAIAVFTLAGWQLLAPILGTDGVTLGMVLGLAVSAIVVIEGNARALGARGIITQLRPAISLMAFAIAILCAGTWTTYKLLLG